MLENYQIEYFFILEVKYHYNNTFNKDFLKRDVINTNKISIITSQKTAIYQ